MTPEERISQLEEENAQLRADAAKYAAVAVHLLTGMRAQGAALGEFLLPELPEVIIKGARAARRSRSPE